MSEPAAGHRVFTLESWGGTDVGMKRRINEDVFLVDDDAGVFLVADGMGGHTAGEVASRLAADAIQGVLRDRMSEEDLTWPEHWDCERSALANRLVDAILLAHSRVTGAVEADEELRGMGTTVVVVVHRTGSPTLVVGHVGDSRAYRIRGGEVGALTNDHSWVHEQVTAGFLSEEAARTHPLKNVVTQALGGSTKPHVDILETEMEDGDLYLLCSDGLNTMLADDEILGLVEREGALGEIGDRLIVAANEAGGNDNVTVVLLKVHVTEESSGPVLQV